MKQKSILSFLIVTVISYSASAQNYRTNYPHTNHKVFYQTNGLHYDLFDEYEYDNQFGAYRYLPTLQSIRYNRVDALFVGVGSDFADPNSEILNIGGVDFDGFIGYSTGQKDWQYRASATKIFGNWILFGEN